MAGLQLWLHYDCDEIRTCCEWLRLGTRLRLNWKEASHRYGAVVHLGVLGSTWYVELVCDGSYFKVRYQIFASRAAGGLHRC